MVTNIIQKLRSSNLCEVFRNILWQESGCKRTFLSVDTRSAVSLFPSHFTVFTFLWYLVFCSGFYFMQRIPHPPPPEPKTLPKFITWISVHKTKTLTFLPIHISWTSGKLTILHFIFKSFHSHQYNPIQFLFMCVPTQQPKGQLQSEHEQRKETKHTQTKYRNKDIYIIIIIIII
jgi:hypothetical protein